MSEAAHLFLRFRCGHLRQLRSPHDFDLYFNDARYIRCPDCEKRFGINEPARIKARLKEARELSGGLEAVNNG